MKSTVPAPMQMIVAFTQLSGLIWPEPPVFLQNDQDALLGVRCLLHRAPCVRGTGNVEWRTESWGVECDSLAVLLHPREKAIGRQRVLDLCLRNLLLGAYDVRDQP